MSRILCIVDGMTDPKFEAALYPHLSSMRFMKEVQTVFSGQPESLTCILHLLGVHEIPDNLRGYAEAVGSGLPVSENDLVLRGSWFALDAQDRCTVPVDAPQSIATDETIRYYPIGQYKCILVCPNKAEKIAQIATFAPCHCAGQKAEWLAPAGDEDLKQLFDQCMTDHICMVPWGQSVKADLKPFALRAAVVCKATIVKGIAKMLCMDVIEPDGATADTDTNLTAKVQATLQAANDYEFVVLHINGADEASHRLNRTEKQNFLHDVDRQVIAPLLQSEHEIYVVSDHETDPETGRHGGVKQPVYTNR